MSELKRYWWGLWKPSGYLLGAVAAEISDELGEEARAEMEGLVYRSDTYGNGEKVSLEVQYGKVTEIQEGLDREVEEENRGWVRIRDGRPPCLRLKRS